MFGRRRHTAAEVPAIPVSRLTDAQILEVVHDKVAELIGEDGEWTVSRRSADDTDTIFHSVLAQSVSVGITTALVDARLLLESGGIGPLTDPRRLTPSVPAADNLGNAMTTLTQNEPPAFDWEPAPLTVWTDLRKPVTGELPSVIPERHAA